MTHPDTSQFAEFKAKRDQWIQCLSSAKDPNSVTNQITQMLWDAAVFRVINEARGYAEKDEDGNPKLNGTTHDLINRGFFVLQAGAIRRLTDTAALTGRKGVSSLWCLLDEMERNVHLITREHIFATEGLQYDYEPIKKAREEYLAGRGACFVPADLWWENLRDRHDQIDFFAGVTLDKRSPMDAMRPEIAGYLKKKLVEVSKDIRTYVNKFIAHAATPESRASVSADELAITLGHLWSAHEGIYKVANFVSIWLLGGSGLGGLAVPQYNQFKYIDRPLVTSANIQRLAESWHGYSNEVHQWGQWDWHECEAEMKGGGPK